MILDQFSQNLNPEEEKINSKIFDLVVGRVLKNVYLSLDSDKRKIMEDIFLSGTDEDREKFIKENVPNFEELFEKESKIIEKELELEIEKEV